MKLKMISNRKSFIFIIVLNGVLVNFIVNARTTLNVFSESTSSNYYFCCCCSFSVLRIMSKVKYTKILIKNLFLEGESCLLHNNKAGTCVHNKDCNWLIKNLESGAMSHSQIVTCSFEVLTFFSISSVCMSIH